MSSDSQSPHYPSFFVFPPISPLPLWLLCILLIRTSFAGNNHTWKDVSCTGILVINGLGFLTLAFLAADIAIGINKDVWWPKSCPADYYGIPCTRQACSMSSITPAFLRNKTLLSLIEVWDRIFSMVLQCALASDVTSRPLAPKALAFIEFHFPIPHLRLPRP